MWPQGRRAPFSTTLMLAGATVGPRHAHLHVPHCMRLMFFIITRAIEWLMFHVQNSTYKYRKDPYSNTQGFRKLLFIQEDLNLQILNKVRRHGGYQKAMCVSLSSLLSREDQTYTSGKFTLALRQCGPIAEIQ